MSLAITEEHRALAAAARAVLTDRAAAQAARAALDATVEANGAGEGGRTGAAGGSGEASGAGGAGGPGLPAVWKDAVELGWLGLHIEERFGGQGYGLPELAVVLEETGRVGLSGPLLPQVLAAAVVAEVGSTAQKERWLPGLCAGEILAAVGLGGSARLDGRALVGDGGPVLGADGADLLFIPVGDDLVAVATGTGGPAAGDPAVAAEADAAAATEADPGGSDRSDDPGPATPPSPTVEADGPQVELEPHASLDPTRPVAAVRLAGVPVTAADVLVGGLAVARRLSWVLAAAEAVGGARACTEMTVAYAGLREQFGRKIGSFQAVKHHCANMLVATELATAAAWDAARPAGDGAEADLVAAVAAARALPAFRTVAELTIQVHGGIGFTWEHEAHRYLRRAAALLALFGPADTAAERVITLREAGVRRRAAVDLPADAEEHRDRARAFAAEYRATPEEQRQVAIARSGYLQPHWPAPFGLAAGPAAQLVIEEELAGLDRPSLGLGEWVVPTVLAHGTPEQVDRWGWPSLEGTLRWCQLFSEPGAGSDAAAVSTSAVRVEGGWRVNGQKVWTSDARACQRGLATVRTDPAAGKHAGITAMVIDMTAPGVDVRPLREITGETLFNEVFFDDVFVPDTDVVGAPGEGWRVARATLGNERVSIGGGSSSMVASELIALAARHAPGDVGLRREIGALLVEEQALRMLNLRQAARAVAAAGPGPEGGLAKLVGAEHAQRITELGLRIAGPAVLLGDAADVVHDFLFTRCLTIAGGTSEVLRNQIAERILGLPRE